jgi:flagellum-specific peptidoglycan hydrolase FlgJ
VSYQQEFINKMTPYAQKAATGTQRDAGVILAQWAQESNWGQDHKANKMNNYGGIRYIGKPAVQKNAVEYKTTNGNGSFAAFRTVDDFVNDFIRVNNLSGYGYPAVRAASTPEQEIKALAASKYDAGGYGGGITLTQIYNKYMSGIGGGTPGKLQGHCLCKQCGYLCQHK